MLKELEEIKQEAAEIAVLVDQKCLECQKQNFTLLHFETKNSPKEVYFWRIGFREDKIISVSKNGGCLKICMPGRRMHL